MNNLYQVIFQAVLSFFVLFIISKVLGKKQIAQLEFIDYAVGISIGSIAAQMAIDPDIPYYHFIIAMAIYAIFDLSLTLISRKSQFLKSFLKGSPLIIISQGKINYKILKKSKLDIDEVISICRIKGYFNLKDIQYCVFEPNGEFSILPKPDSLPTVKKDLQIKETSSDFGLHLVIDGKVNKKALKRSGKTENWVFEKAKVKNRKELKNIMLLTYFENQDKVNVFLKS
jgi:uncharacterized membrane protein YcaP (DUF421 family)